MSLKEEMKKILRGEKLTDFDTKTNETRLGERTESIVNSKPAIDFQAIAESSEFQRFIYYLFTGKVHRGTLNKLKKDISNFRQDAELIQNYKKVMQELKEKLKERKIE